MQTNRNLLSMAATYSMGVFNDNFFKQAALLLAVTTGMGHLQGTATVLFSLPFILFSAYGGWLADRFPKKDVIVSVKFLELCAMLIGAAGLIFSNWTCILAMVFLMGLQSSLFSPALNGSIPEQFTDPQIPRINGLLKMITTMAILLGIGCAGFALDLPLLFIGQNSDGRATVALVCILIALTGIIAAIGIGRQQAAAPARRFPWAGPFRSLQDTISLRRNPELLLAIGSESFFYLIASITILAVNEFGLLQLGMSTSQTSLLSAALMVGIAAGSMAGAKLFTIITWKKSLLPGSIGMATGLLATATAASLPHHLQQPVLFLSLTITGFCGGLFLIPVTSFIQARPSIAEKGKTIATANFCTFAGIVASGYLFTLLGPIAKPATILVMLGLACLPAVLLYAILPHLGGNLGQSFLRTLVSMGLKLRYSITVEGLDTIKPIPGRSILFLPNHPALIDPVILMSVLHKKFKPRPLADHDQINKPLIRSLMTAINAITLPDIFKNGRRSRDHIQEALNICVKSLKAGDNLLLYPAGRLYRSGQESLGGNSGVEHIIREIPDQEIVLIRTTGLWGSSFSWAGGKSPGLTRPLKQLIPYLLGNLILFGPRRKVTIECSRPEDLPRQADRMTINRSLEAFYNREPESNMSVPLFRWQGKTPVVQEETGSNLPARDLEGIPKTLKEKVIRHLATLAGVDTVKPDDHLARDLGIDSLNLMETAQWLESEFGMMVEDIGTLHTVSDCILAAHGEQGGNVTKVQSVTPPKWFKSKGEEVLEVPWGETIAEVFLTQAGSKPASAILADQISGVKTYRDLITGILVLKPMIEKLPEQHVGIMLPASVSASLAYLAVMFSGKVPVMVNWTVGTGHMDHCLKTAGVRHVLTASALLDKLEDQGMDFSGLDVNWVRLDRLKETITLPMKLSALVRSRISWAALRQTRIADTAAILFTSGSEAKPKAVPLSHANILANMRGFSSVLSFRQNDRLLGILPPFHSLGLAGNCVLPLCMGLKTVYHANPTEGSILARLTEKYRTSLVIGTPTFLNGMIRSAAPKQLNSLRLAFTGAEKCPDHVYRSFSDACPDGILLEGYGITECSPVVSINHLDAAKPGTIGSILPGMEYRIVHPESKTVVRQGKQGLLLVRGANVFDGYLQGSGSSPFVRIEQKEWYNTGDLVEEDMDGTLTFRGRLKRFIKLGGEMISLPAIESALQSYFPASPDGGPSLAVEATASEQRPELVLFCTFETERMEVNRMIRETGLSALHNIQKMIRLDAIPVLGTGKTDYQQLKASLQPSAFR